MKPFTTALLVLAAAAAINGAAPSSSAIARDIAQVNVQRVTKRSAGESATYHATVTGLGRQVQLNLASPGYSIFTPGFRYLEASADPVTREVHFQDLTPSKQEMKSIENNFYTDLGSDAAVSLKRGAEDSFQLSGRIDDMSLVNSEGNHQLYRKAAPQGRLDDYIDLNRTITPGPTSRATSYATPEVFVVFDYADTLKFNNDRTKILDYLGVFFHAINNRYDTATDPKISFRISGVTTVSSRSAQPYVENNAVSGGGYDIGKVLEDYSKWLYSNSGRTPKYDLGALITGEDMKMKDSSGNWNSNVAGLAYVKAACWNHTQLKQYLGSSVTEDIGGYYDGMFSVAHELAHNMGAPHDGDGDAKSCSWEDGYIMSYKGWGTKNKFYFSSCSLSLMKGLVDSTQGACTKSQQNPTQVPISNDNVGDRLNMQQLCVKYTNNNEAVPDPDTSADDLCKNLKCRYPYAGRPGWYQIRTMNHPPGDNSPCGNGGKCVNGDCVGASG